MGYDSCGYRGPATQSHVLISEFPQANPLPFQTSSDTFATSPPLSLRYLIVLVLFSDAVPTSHGILGCCVCGVWMRCSGGISESHGCPGL